MIHLQQLCRYSFWRELLFLINSVVLDSTGWFKSFISAETMATWQNWGNIITNSTLNITGYHSCHRNWLFFLAKIENTIIQSA